MVRKNYARELVSRAVSDFHVRTDIWYAAASVITSAFAAPSKQSVADLTTSQIAQITLIAVTIFALLRLLIFAPYRLWRESQDEIVDLKQQLDDPRRRRQIAFEHAQEGDRADFIRELRRYQHWDQTKPYLLTNPEMVAADLKPKAGMFMSDLDFWIHWQIFLHTLNYFRYLRECFERQTFHEGWHNRALGNIKKRQDCAIEGMINILSGQEFSYDHMAGYEQLEKEFELFRTQAANEGVQIRTLQEIGLETPSSIYPN